MYTIGLGLSIALLSKLKLLSRLYAASGLREFQCSRAAGECIHANVAELQENVFILNEEEISIWGEPTEQIKPNSWVAEPVAHYE